MYRVVALLSLYLSYSCLYAQSDSAIQNDILLHINKYRQAHHLKPLKMDARIVKEAKNHSIDMANHTVPFGHQYFKSRVDRIREHIKQAGGCGKRGLQL